MSLDYSSSSVDSLTWYTNNQAGWVGTGWDLGVGFIERQYKSCPLDEDNDDSPQQLCWDAHDDLTLSVGGRSSRIVKDSGSGAWKTVDDYGWKIDQVSTGGDSGQPHWKVITQDGTVYRFGFHRDSSFQVPFLGAKAGDPCHDKYSQYSTPPLLKPPADRFCYSTWRWMLDQEIDPKGNVTDYSYTREQNTYCIVSGDACRDAGGNLPYDRGGYLAQMTYGSNTNVAGSTATARVMFTAVERGQGLPGSTPRDVPWDLNWCTDPTSCFNTADGPTFYVTKRLDNIVTQSWNPSSNGWDDVTRLELRYKWVETNPSATDKGPVLWLDTFRTVGLAGDGPDVARPPLQFDATLLANRFGWLDALPRMSAVGNGLGGRTEITYGQPSGCPLTTESKAVDRDDAGYDCYWVFTNFYTDVNNVQHVQGEVYNKWLVTQVVDKDLVAASPDVLTRYEYLGTPAWARAAKFDETTGNYEVPAPRCINWAFINGAMSCTEWSDSWTEWRGYSTVRVSRGSGTDPGGYSVSSSTFYRGMYEDPLANGTPKHIQVTDFDGTAFNDLRTLAGKTLQEQTWRRVNLSPQVQCTYPAWSGSFYPTGTRVSYNNRHWESLSNSFTSNPPSSGAKWKDLGPCPTITPAGYNEEASTRYEYANVVTGNGPGIADPHQVNPNRQVAREKVSSGWRYTETATAYNADGLPIKVNDYGERGVAGDNTCTATTYARNTSGSAWMISYPASVERRAGDDCTSGTFMGRTVTLYDGATSESANTPTKGNATETRTYTSSSDFTRVKADFDGYGRTLSATDPLGKTTTTTYNPAVGWPGNGVTVTNPLGHTATTWTSAAYGGIVGIRDANGHDTNIDYDALGRTTMLWTPAQPRSGDTPAATVTYTIPTDANGVVAGAARTAVARLQSGTGAAAKYVTTYTYDDGLGRTRETQTASPAGGRIVSPVIYDARGLTAATGAPTYNTAQSGSGLLNPALTALPQWNKPIYDGLERVVAAVDMSGATELRRTTTTYFGDRTEVSPPVGGKTVTYTDADDQVTKVEEWKDATTHYDTRYEYNLNGQLIKQTDANGNVRTFTYDLMGRRKTAHDPDAGDSEQDYDAAGRLLWSTNGKGQKVSYSYDDLGRKTAVWSGDAGTGTKLAEWVYDTIAKGQLTSATRFVGGNAFVDAVTGYDVMGRPTGSALTIPSSEGLLAGTYAFSISYNSSGTVAEHGMPAAGGLPAEKVTSTYSDIGLPQGLTSDLGGGFTYVGSTTYSPTGRLAERTYGANGKIKRTLTWDNATGWLSRVTTTTKADTSSPMVSHDDQYFYDTSGEITRILDAASATGGSPGQSECFAYDGLHRLSQAWTTTASTCGSGTASADNLGIDPYAQSYAYDPVGNITSVTSGGQSSTYAYPQPGTSAVRPNAVTSITRPGGTDTYNYDAVGQLTSRTVGGKAGTFVWNELGELEKATIDGQDTTMVYDADGDRLIRRDPTGRTTLYLGSMEIEVVGSTITGKRYYTAPDGALVAMRTGGSGITWLMSGLHGSTQLAVNDTTGQVSRERYLPFGQRRGSDDLPFTDHGFLGKIEDDSTGLDLLGARYYDPAIAKFISTDPLLDLRKPQWANPYAYSGNNPIGASDPTGLAPLNCEPNQANYQQCMNEEAWADCVKKLGKLKCAEMRYNKAKNESEGYWQQFLGALKEIAKIAADELGITDALNCFTKGDIGACGSTALNVLASVAGGFAGKLAAKYGLPWKWKKAYEVGKKLAGAITTAYDRFKGWLKAEEKLAAAKTTYSIYRMLKNVNVDNIKMTETVRRHLDDITKRGESSRPYMNSKLLLKEIIESGMPKVDPRGVATALRWDVAGTFRGRKGVWELVVDTKTNTILHFNFVGQK